MTGPNFEYWRQYGEVNYAGKSNAEQLELFKAWLSENFPKTTEDTPLTFDQQVTRRRLLQHMQSYYEAKRAGARLPGVFPDELTPRLFCALMDALSPLVLCPGRTFIMAWQERALLALGLQAVSLDFRAAAALVRREAAADPAAIYKHKHMAPKTLAALVQHDYSETWRHRASVIGYVRTIAGRQASSDAMP